MLILQKLARISDYKKIEVLFSKKTSIFSKNTNFELFQKFYYLNRILR